MDKTIKVLKTSAYVDAASGPTQKHLFVGSINENFLDWVISYLRGGQIQGFWAG
jgi:hypothetical protein